MITYPLRPNMVDTTSRCCGQPGLPKERVCELVVWEAERRWGQGCPLDSNDGLVRRLPRNFPVGEDVMSNDAQDAIISNAGIEERDGDARQAPYNRRLLFAGVCRGRG